MNCSQISLLLILTIHVCFVNTEILYGASVHWRPISVTGTSTNNGITLSYKLIWKRDFLPLCQPHICRNAYLAGQTSATVAKPRILTVPRWQGYHWKCVDGCSTNRIITNLTELFYTDIDTFHNISWEAAVEMVTFRFTKGDDRANVKIGFYDSNDSPVDGLSEGILSMATRNDTKRANISPAINPLPYYRVPIGCNITIRFFPFDGDGDYVRCHWQRFPQEESSEPKATLIEDKCELTVVADPNEGFAAGDNFTLKLYAEDYSTKPVQMSSLSDDITTGPFSRTPFVAFLFIGESTTCTPGPDFINAGTLPPNYVGSLPLPFYSNTQLPFKIPTDDNQTVLTSGPRSMAFRFNKDPLALQFEGTWDYINDTGMTGIHQACGMTYTKHGVPGDTRCAVLLVNEPNECPCPKVNGVNGTCRNLFEYHTCDYSSNSSQIIDQLRQTVTEQQQNISQLQALVSHQLQDGCQSSNRAKSTSDDDDDMKLIVGLPVGLSLLWLIILIIVTCILKHYIDKKKQNTNINPDDSPSNSKFKGVPSVW